MMALLLSKKRGLRKLERSGYWPERLVKAVQAWR
jgi:hypothetical protein